MSGYAEHRRDRLQAAALEVADVAARIEDLLDVTECLVVEVLDDEERDLMVARALVLGVADQLHTRAVRVESALSAIARETVR